MALKKFCPRCNKIIDYSQLYCDECKVKVEEQQKKRHKDYKAARMQDVEEKKYQDFYVSKEWIVTRDQVKVKYVGLCLYSLFLLGEIVPADVVHHVEELKECWELRIDKGNLIPLSDGIHNQVHLWYKQGRKKEIQELLRSLIERWEKEYGNGIKWK